MVHICLKRGPDDTNSNFFYLKTVLETIFFPLAVKCSGSRDKVQTVGDADDYERQEIIDMLQGKQNPSRRAPALAVTSQVLVMCILFVKVFVMICIDIRECF